MAPLERSRRTPLRRAGALFPGAYVRHVGAPAGSRPPPAAALASWPGYRSGWTVVVSSIPVAAGRDAAEREAREARAAGLDAVGVLASRRFSTLRPG